MCLHPNIILLTKRAIYSRWWQFDTKAINANCPFQKISHILLNSLRIADGCTSVCLSVRPSVCSSVSLYVCVSVCLCLSVGRSVGRSVSLSVCLLLTLWENTWTYLHDIFSIGRILHKKQPGTCWGCYIYPLGYRVSFVSRGIRVC